MLGLSAAKGHNVATNYSALDSIRSKNVVPVVPNVSVTPSLPTGTSSTPNTQKPFSVTVTNVPSPQATPKELSSFLQQSLEQPNTSKSQKNTTTLPKPSYSHEAKVNKWLAEQASVESRRRGLPPRLAPDEHVPVVHRVTGKRLIGHKAPQLKHLAQWIAENPMYDIDSKWTEGIKEHVKLPQDVRAQRHSPMHSSSSLERKKGRPPTLEASASSSHLNQNLTGINPALLASLSSLTSFDQKTLATTLSNLTGLDSKTLASFDPKLLSSLTAFDPKNNPLLNSFGSIPNLLGNITGGNIFANLASLGLSGFSGLDMANLNVTGSNIDSKSKSRKHTDATTSSSKTTSSQFPFVFPNPNMIYPQLGLSGMNPFGMQAGISSAYDALGFLSNNLVTSSSTIHNTQSSTRSTSKTSLPRSSTVTTNTASSSHSRQKSSNDRQQSAQLSQLLLPPDTHLLESLSKQCMSYDSVGKTDKRLRDIEMMDPSVTDLSKVDRKKSQSDVSRTQLPPEFAAVQERLLKGDKRDIDISKMLLEQMASGALSASLVSSAESKKNPDPDGKELYEKQNKNTPDYTNRNIVSENLTISSHKRHHDDISNEPENLVADMSMPKRVKEKDECKTPSSIHIEKQLPSHTSNTGEMDLEDLIAPSTVIKTGVKPSIDMENSSQKNKPISQPSIVLDGDGSDRTHIPYMMSGSKSYLEGDLIQHDGTELDLSKEKPDIVRETNDGNENILSEETGDPNEASRRNAKKKGRKSTEEITWGGVRRELRSSTGKQSTR